MNLRIIDDITKFVFISDKIERSDIIFIPGGSHPQLGEYTAQLYKEGLADLIMPSGCFSIKTGKFDGVKAKKELYNKNYLTECEFLTDVLHINGVPYDVEFLICPVPYFNGNIELTADNWYKTESGVNRVLGELQRYGSQFRNEFLNLSCKGEF